MSTLGKIWYWLIKLKASIPYLRNSTSKRIPYRDFFGFTYEDMVLPAVILKQNVLSKKGTNLYDLQLKSNNLWCISTMQRYIIIKSK